jgi:hypothetical protein
MIAKALKNIKRILLIIGGGCLNSTWRSRYLRMKPVGMCSRIGWSDD